MNFSRDCPIYVLVILTVCIFVFFAAWSAFIEFNYRKGYTGRLFNHQYALTNETLSCPLDFCTDSHVDRVFDRQDLLAFYSVAAVMVLLYFIFEHGFCHRCLAMESVYIYVVVYIFVLGSLFWERSVPAEVDVSAAVEVRTSAFIVLALLVLRCHADLDATVPDFFARPGAREIAKRNMHLAQKKPPPKSVRVTAELSDAMHEVVGDDPNYSGKFVATCMFAFFLVEELSLAWSSQLRYPILVCTMIFNVVVVFFILQWAYWVCWVRRHAVKRIQELAASFDSDDPEGLRYMLANLSVGTLINLGGSPVQDTLMQALEDDMLDTLSKAIIIDALQKTGLAASPREQAEVQMLFFSCEGDDLVTLKTLIDGSGGYHNLHKLMFTDMRQATIRDGILQHFTEEADKIRESRGGCIGVKVLSDVDDTLLSSGGKFPAGCDKSYPHHLVYPGCLAFYRALDCSWQPEVPSCNLVFLSARPHVYKDRAEKTSYHVFNTLVSDGSMHSLPTLLAGKLISGAWATVAFKCLGTQAWKQVGIDKFNSYTQFTQLYPEYDFVFCGDDGQGDLLAGQFMLQDDGGAPSCRVVVVHQVLTTGTPLMDDSLNDEENESRLILHKSYVGAAVSVHLADPLLLPKEKLEEVATAAVEDFEIMRLTYPDWYNSCEGKAAEENVRLDLDRARGLLGQRAPQLRMLSTFMYK